MKTNAKKLSIALFTLSAALFGCKKDDLSPVTTVHTVTSKTTNTNKDLSNGSWSVQPSHVGKTNTKKPFDKKVFDKHPIDLVNPFAGWDFQFKDNGAVVASKNGKQVEGKWKTEEAKMKQTIKFDFGPEMPFSQLNQDWLLVKDSGTYQLYPVEPHGGVLPLTLER